MTTTQTHFNNRVAKLIQLSRDQHISDFTRFDWSQTLSDNDWWISPELLTLHGTSYFEQASEAQLKLLSKWECINLFSLNVTGEQELLAGVAELLHTPMLKEVNEYLHHFIDEENQHMWYFGKFCEIYGGKIYGNKKLQLSDLQFDTRLAILTRFAQIFIFEEVGHYYNVKTALDSGVHPFIREINDAHRNDEARHITFGRALLSKLASGIEQDYPSATLLKISNHLRRYIKVTIESLYNPAMYRDAGFVSGIAIRSALLADSRRQDFHAGEHLKKIISLLLDIHLLQPEIASEPSN